MPALTANNAVSRLAGSLTIDQTTLSVTAGDGAKFPSIANNSGDWFPVTLQNANGDMEIVRVTARSGDRMTVARGQEGTRAIAWNVGDRAELRYTSAVHGETLQKGGNLGGIADIVKARSNLGLASAATRGVGTAPNQLMEVGAFGLGATTAQEVTDLNLLRGSQFFGFANSGNYSNYPPAAGGWDAAGIHIDVQGQLNQLVFAGGEDIWTRCNDNNDYSPNNWGPWRELLHTGNINRIFESGGSASSSYVRLFDGTMICVARMSFSTRESDWSLISNAAGIYSYTLPRVSFASTFAAMPAISPTIGEYVWFRNRRGGVSNTGATIDILRESAAAYSNVDVTIVAVGRWK